MADKIELKIGNISIINGVVSRRSGNQYGIFFPESFRGNELDPPDSLQAIFTKLEIQWFRKRVKD